jgi:hypothetical protein
MIGHNKSKGLGASPVFIVYDTRIQGWQTKQGIQ